MSRLADKSHFHVLQDPSAEPSDKTTTSLSKKIRAMLEKIDAQLSDYDARVGSSLQLISCDGQGKIPVRDLEKALMMIKHKPEDEDLEGIVRKLDVDQDGYVVLEHVLELVREEGLGAFPRYAIRSPLTNSILNAFREDRG
jgi:LETM1 and EF-hand domain-containing protein 1